MNQKIDALPVDTDESVNAVIRETERYYREQIFSSGCSSLVPIYRISENTSKPERLLQQLYGSPYIQKNVIFSQKVIETFLDITLYRYQDWHFFFQGDIQSELQDFIEKECEKTPSFSHIAKYESNDQTPSSTWRTLQNDVDLITQDYPFMSTIPISELLRQIQTIIRYLNMHQSVESYLDFFHNADWHKKVKLNQSSMLCMVAISNKLGWNTSQIKTLIMLGLLKDVGYTRLNEHIENFEVLHPLVSHKLILECNKLADKDESIPPIVTDAILMHHEFTDGSGPLGRMRHPHVTQLLGARMPEIAQLSGICDLFFGFLNDYSPGVAFSITCGFVLGQGRVDPRYTPRIIKAFSEVVQEGAYRINEIQPDEASQLITDIINVLHDPDVRHNANKMINTKTSSWYERITLALNIVRNIARFQPKQIGENQLVNILQLPIEFGLNY